MKSVLKRNIFLVIGISLIIIAFEIFTSLEYALLFGVSFLIFCGGLFIGNQLVRRIIMIISLFMIGIVIFMTKSVWFLVAAIILLLILFSSSDGNAMIDSQETLLHPYSRASKYQGIQIIRSQTEQRTLLNRQSVIKSLNQNQTDFEWHDINLVYIGGDNIIDLGNTVLPTGESIVVIRKIFGRTRIIVPRNVGLSFNVSAVSGQIVFEQETYALTGENFQWISPGYSDASRKVRILISVTFGDVEVIIL